MTKECLVKSLTQCQVACLPYIIKPQWGMVPLWPIITLGPEANNWGNQIQLPSESDRRTASVHSIHKPKAEHVNIMDFPVQSLYVRLYRIK